MVREAQFLDKICAGIKPKDKISIGQRRLLRNVFGKRFETALKAVEEGAVKKYIFKPGDIVIWIVVGKEKDYQILPSANYCSCDDFYYRIIDGVASLCYHIIAQKLAESLRKFETIVDSEDLYGVLMSEWRFVKKGNFQE